MRAIDMIITLRNMLKNANGLARWHDRSIPWDVEDIMHKRNKHNEHLDSAVELRVRHASGRVFTISVKEES